MLPPIVPRFWIATPLRFPARPRTPAGTRDATNAVLEKLGVRGERADGDLLRPYGDPAQLGAAARCLRIAVLLQLSRFEQHHEVGAAGKRRPLTGLGEKLQRFVEALPRARIS